MHPDFAAALLDPGSDLEQFQPQRVKGGRGKRCACKMVTQQPHQAIGIRVQQQAELVGGKAVAAETVGF